MAWEPRTSYLDEFTVRAFCFNRKRELSHLYLCFDGRPPKDIEEAWEITLHKWFVLSLASGVHDGGGDTCGLCMFQDRKSEPSCDGCVLGKTKECEDEGRYGKYISSGRYKKAAKEFLEFLLEMRYGSQNHS